MKRTSKTPEDLVSKVNKAMRQKQTSEFYELIPHINTENETGIGKRYVTENARRLLKQFHDVIGFQYPDVSASDKMKENAEEKM